MHTVDAKNLFASIGALLEIFEFSIIVPSSGELIVASDKIASSHRSCPKWHPKHLWGASQYSNGCFLVSALFHTPACDPETNQRKPS